MPELIGLLRADRKDPASRGRKAAHPASVCGILRAIGPGARSSVPALTDYLGDPNADVRMAAAAALVEIGADSPNLERALASLLDDKNPAVRVEAVRSTFSYERMHSGPPDLLQKLTSTLDDKDTDVRVEVARLLWKIRKDASLSVATLIQVLNGPDRKAGVCGDAALTLAEIGPMAREAIPVILNRLGRNPEDWEVLKLQIALFKIQGPSKDLEKSLSDLLTKKPLLAIRGDVAAALLGLKSRPVEEATIRAYAHFTDKANGILDPEFAFEEIFELGVVATPLVPLLREALEDKDPFHRQMAARALGAIGPPAKAAQVALARLARCDDDLHVRLQASHALRAILDRGRTLGRS
jgi:HEAT repeat protein